MLGLSFFDYRILRNNSYLILESKEHTADNESSTYYVLLTNDGGIKKENVAFRRWSEILKVPYSYSKKNPSSILDSPYFLLPF